MGSRTGMQSRARLCGMAKKAVASLHASSIPFSIISSITSSIFLSPLNPTILPSISTISSFPPSPSHPSTILSLHLHILSFIPLSLHVFLFPPLYPTPFLYPSFQSFFHPRIPLSTTLFIPLSYYTVHPCLSPALPAFLGLFKPAPPFGKDSSMPCLSGRLKSN